MITYVIQISHNGVWHNLNDYHGYQIEFVSLCGAKSIAKNLAGTSSVFPSNLELWQVVSSKGIKIVVK